MGINIEWKVILFFFRIILCESMSVRFFFFLIINGIIYFQGKVVRCVHKMNEEIMKSKRVEFE